MQTNSLFPPNLHSLSSNVIGDVALRSDTAFRSDNTNYVTDQSSTEFNSTKKAPTGRRPSPPVIPPGKLPYADEMKENIAAYHRERRRKNQERYRAKQRKSMAALETRNQKMEEEIRQLQRTRDILKAKRPATTSTVWSVAVEYFQVFRHGLPSTGETRTIGLDFLEATMAPELDAGTVQGLDAFTQNWTVFTQLFADVQLQLSRLDQVADNSLVATATTSFTITESSLRSIFPRLSEENEWSDIAAKLLNQRLVMRGSVHFSWDSDNNRVMRLISQSDMVSPLLQVLGTVQDVAAVLNCVRTNPDCNLVVPVVWTSER